MLYQISIPIQEQLNSITSFEIQTDLGAYVSNIVSVLLSAAALATFAFLVWGGINWITAGGDKGKIEEARNRITQAIIGLTIVAASWAIFLLVNYFFGLGMAGGSRQPKKSNSSTGSGGSCSTSSAARCQGRNPGYACDTDRTCDPLNNQKRGDDGKVKCACNPNS
jgi:hypothetical protein